jgi:predicted RND superfamily exporter protein
MDWIANAILRLRIPILVAAFAATAWLGSYIPRIQFDSSSDGSVPRGDPEQAFFEDAIETFGNDQVSMAVIVAPGEDGVFNRGTLEKIGRLTSAIQKIEGVQEVVSLTNARYLTGAEGVLETPLVVPEIPGDLQGMRDLRDFVLGDDLFLKTLVSADGKAAAINVFMRDYPDAELIALDIDGKIQALLEKEQGPEELHYAGLTYTRRVINATMHRDLRIFIPLTLVFIGLVLLLTFRNFRGVALPLLVMIMSIVLTMGLIGYLQKPFSLVLTVLPPFLIAVGSTYAIHVLSHFDDHMRRTPGISSGDAARLTVKELFLPVAMSAVTTMIGFGSLIINSIPNIQKMGLFSTIGTGLAFLVTITVLPAILSLVRKPRVKAVAGKSGDRMERFMVWLVGFIEDHRGWIVLFIILTSGLSVWGFLRMKVDTNFLSYFDERTEIRKTTDIIAKNLAGASTFYLVVEGKERDSMKRPDLLKAVDRIQSYMEGLPGVDKTVSIVGHLKRLHMALNYDDPDSLIVPGDAGIIEEELLLFSIAHDPAAMERYVNGDFRKMTVFARTSLVGSSEILGTIRKISDYAREVLPQGFTAKPTGTIIVLTYAAESIATGQRNSLVSALALIFVVMALLLRSFGAGFYSMLPNIFPILIVFGIMGFAGISLNIGTSIIACTAIGIAVDDTIHFMTEFGRHMQKSDDRRSAMREIFRSIGKPVIYTSVTLFFGFLILSVSDFEIISSVGFLTGITMLTALVGELLILPILLLSTRTMSRKSHAPGMQHPHAEGKDQ